MAGKPSFLADTADEEGFTADEKAQMEAAPDAPADDQPPEAEQPAEQEAEPKADAKPNGKDTQEREHGGDLGKALKEEREYRRQLQTDKANMERTLQQILARVPTAQQPQPNGQQQPQNVPSYDQDPIGYLKAQNEQLAKHVEALSGHAQQRTQADQQQQFYSDVMSRYEASRSQFARQTPDYAEADAWLRQSRDQELEALGMDDPAERKAMIERDEGFFAYRALATGKNPAEQFYRLAQQRGFKAKTAQPAENNLDRLARGQKAAASLGATRNAPGGKPELTLEYLSTLQGADFDKAWATMERQGKLG